MPFVLSSKEIITDASNHDSVLSIFQKYLLLALVINPIDAFFGLYCFLLPFYIESQLFHLGGEFTRLAHRLV